MAFRTFSFVTFVLALIALPISGGAAEWPARPIKIVVPAAPGGGTDLIARLIGDKLREALQQAIIIENKPGGEELIAEEYVANSPPDGYTVLISASPIAVNPSLHRKLPFDAARDFQAVAQIATLPFVLAINTKLTAKTVPDLVSLSHKQANGLNAAVGGAANLLVTERFRLNTGANLTLIPYKGCGPATQSVLAGETDLVFCSAPAVAQLVLAGRLKALAVTGDKRLSMMPTVPTTKEMNVPAYHIDLSQWQGAFVPANTPHDVVMRLNLEINKALAAPDVIAKIAQAGAEPTPMSVDAATQFYHAELAKFKDLVTRAKIPLEN